MIKTLNSTKVQLSDYANLLADRDAVSLEEYLEIYKKKITQELEVNGETYHAEGIIPNENFDDNLNRQNEILNAGEPASGRTSSAP